MSGTYTPINPADRSGFYDTGAITVPSTYPAGGIVLDLTDKYSSLDSVLCGFSNLAGVLVMQIQQKINQPLAGKVTIQLFGLSVGVLLELSTGLALTSVTMTYQAMGTAK